MSDIEYIRKKLAAACALILYKKAKKNFPYRRKLTGKGIVIAFMGIDGAGKSTVIERLSRFLSWKIDYYHTYFGSGDGKSSLLRLPFLLIAKSRAANRGDARRIDKRSMEKSHSAFHLRFAKFLWAVLLVLEKKKKMRKTREAKDRGLIVICDRYPQSTVFGLNDGPLLTQWLNGRNAIKRRIAEWEIDAYRLLSREVPDVLIKLMIPVETALKRKIDTPEYIIREKAAAVSSISYAGTRTIEISTECTIEETMRQVKLAIWTEIASRYAC